ncbi:MAG: HAD family phosphatase [Desulfovibrionaceae bacterium]|nr:HAD family phosphatase [Desulfovibrionaceae bacterium]
MPSGNKLELLVFDCDGVILETVDVKTRAFAQIAEPYGAEIRDRLVLYHHLHGGVSRREKFRWMLEEALGGKADEAELDDLCARFGDAVLEQVMHAPLVPGVMDVIETWQKRVPLYVCSGTPQEELRFILRRRGLDRYFTDMIGTPPAKPELLKRIVRAAGADPSRCVMIGDAGTDLLAAEAAETLFYGRGEFFKGGSVPYGQDLTGLNAWLDSVFDQDPVHD